MAATATTVKLLANVLIKHYDFDPDSTNAVDIDWVDMRDFEVITASFFRTIGTGALDTFTFLGNTQSDGGGTDRIIKAHAVANEPNAEGDQIFLEITANDLAEVGAALATPEQLRYVTISAEFATNSDEGVVTYIRSGAKHPRRDLTAEIIA